MTYIVNESCIKCKYMDCVEVCPVDCFYEGENMLFIHPDECIDCGVCEPDALDAIKPDTEPGFEKWLDINAKYSQVWPNITVKREPPPDAKDWEASLTRSTCYRQTLAQVIESWTVISTCVRGQILIHRPGDEVKSKPSWIIRGVEHKPRRWTGCRTRRAEMFERVPKRVKTESRGR